MPHALTWLDVFTSHAMSGNGLAVVHDADDVPDDAMLAFARETRLSETTFVQSATEHGADYRNRIWMTQGELPFAGHPSLGTAVAVARARGEREVRYVQQTGAGLQSIEVELAGDGHVAHASMLQEPATFGAEVDPADVLPALGSGRSAPLTSIAPTQPFAPGTLIAAGISLLGLQWPQAPTTFVQTNGAFAGRCSHAGGAHVLRVTSRPGTPVPKPSPTAEWGLHLVDANIAQGDLLKVLRRQERAYARGVDSPAKGP